MRPLKHHLGAGLRPCPRWRPARRRCPTAVRAGRGSTRPRRSPQRREAQLTGRAPLQPAATLQAPPPAPSRRCASRVRGGGSGQQTRAALGPPAVAAADRRPPPPAPPRRCRGAWSARGARDRDPGPRQPDDQQRAGFRRGVRRTRDRGGCRASAAARQQYQLVTPTELQRPDSTGPNIFAYALGPARPKGTQGAFRRGLGAIGRRAAPTSARTIAATTSRRRSSWPPAGRSATGWASTRTATATPATGIRRWCGGWCGTDREMTFSVRDCPSPNHGPRRGGVARPDLIVIHYTAMRGGPEPAIRVLCDPEREVSCHYVIGETGGHRPPGARRPARLARGRGALGRGRRHQLPLDRDRAVERRSLALSGTADGQRWRRCCTDLMARHGIAPKGVIGHSDCAPGRKIDPGPRFDWRRLARRGLSVWPDADAPPTQDTFRADARAFGITADVDDATAAGGVPPAVPAPCDRPARRHRRGARRGSCRALPGLTRFVRPERLRYHRRGHHFH